MLKSTPQRFGTAAITLHWFSAALILIALVTGIQADNAANSADTVEYLRIHVPVALLAFLMTLVRITWWWFYDTVPLAPSGTPRWQIGVAQVTRVLIYATIIGMVASGLSVVFLSGTGPILLGNSSGELPDFHNYGPRAVHGLGGNLLMLLLVFHIVAALYHHFVRRDGLIRRMWYH